MFLPVLFIVLGALLLLNAMGIITGNFWGFFWAIVFLTVGIKMMIHKGGCPVCSCFEWKEKMNGHCCDGHHHDEHNQ